MTTVERIILVRVSGRDRPGITTGLLAVLSEAGVNVYDIEQVTVRQRLTLDLLVGVPDGSDVVKELLYHGWENGLQVDFERVEPAMVPATTSRSVVTVIGQALPPASLRDVTGAIAETGGNIERIVRLSRYPVMSFEFVVVGAQVDRMRERLVLVSAEQGIDVAVQRETLGRRAKRLVLMDVDSTLIQDEAIDLLAAEVGRSEEVAELTERAMAGQLDFADALRRRVELLAGTPVEVLEGVRDRVRLTPGARTFVRTLKRLGYTVAAVSGGFSVVTDRLVAELDLDHAVANELEVADGRLTGRVVGDVLDRVGKAEVLRRIADAEGVPLEQTVAVGDGANDLDMLAAAGLGIAFNAKPGVREVADTSLSVPYLDAILFMLGISRDEVEAADRADPNLELDGLLPVPGTPPV